MSINDPKEDNNLDKFPEWNYTADVTIRFLIAPVEGNAGPTQVRTVSTQMQGDNQTIGQSISFNDVCNIINMLLFIYN